MAIQTATYEISFYQRAQPNRIVYEPGKTLADCEHHRYEVVRDYHIPVGNPSIESMLRESYHWKDQFTIGNPIMGAAVFPTPVVLKTTVTTVTTAKAEGTHVLQETELVDIEKASKPQGGHAFNESV